MRHAQEAFQFVAASYLIRIRQERALTLSELASHLRACSEESIFYHTFQSLETHHYSTFSSDFAQWIQAGLNEQELAERLATVDLRGIAMERLEARLDRLKATRNAIAKRLDLAPGVLCPNGTLEAIAKAAPQTVTELAALPEVRTWQVEVLGEELVEAARGGKSDGPVPG